ncbi:MAG: Asparagine synthetase [Gemmatimonadetes bacterium]|nr:Asparagine synthetase [Gemmatimonadota bacterium]
MCGIAGAFGNARGGDVVGRMTACLAHRGPDDGGLTRLIAPGGDPAGAFGHRRLAIIDLSPLGHQPMFAQSSGERHVLVFNGEIYNYRELRLELQQDGVQFRSTSDTEVILEGLIRHGARYVARLRGMFALAWWDSHAGRGVVARDQFGMKPLYLARREGNVLFASEVRGLLSSGMVERRASPRALAGYLASGSVPEPLAMIAGVEMLPAGHFAEVTVANGVATCGAPRAFAPALEGSGRPLVRDAREAARMVEAALRDSVQGHLIADTPVGSFLSGGIDSSVITTLAAESSASPIDTFTIVLGEAGFDEAAYARAIAHRLGTRHHEIPLGGGDMLEALPAALRAMDQPSLDGLNTFAVSRAVRERGIKVVLSGLGGDELFAGYPSFARARRVARLWLAPDGVRRAAGALMGRRGGRAEKIAAMVSEQTPARGAYEGSRTLFGPRALLSLGVVPDWPRAGDAPPNFTMLQQVSWYEVTGYMRSTLLRDSDVFSMSHGLELRVPFVDRAVAAASMAIDDSLKMRQGVNKPLLIDAMGAKLPREVWDRPKQGFALPLDHWMRGELYSEVERALLDPVRVRRSGLDPAGVAMVWSGFLARQPGLSWSRPWALFTLVRWAEQVGLEGGAAEPAEPQLLEA